MASNQHHHPTATISSCAQWSDYKVLQRRHQYLTNTKKYWGNQGPSGSHVKPPAVDKKWATPSTSQQGTPRPSPKEKSTLKYTTWIYQAQISTGALLGQAIKECKPRNALQKQIRAQVIVLGTWEKLGGTGVIEKSFWRGGKAR